MPIAYTLPVFFHNLQGYDAHLILNGVKKRHGEISSIIAKTQERFTTFRVGRLVFKDSMSFLAKSLDSLIKTLLPSEMMMMRNYINTLCTPNAQPAVVTGEVINEEPPEIVQPSTSLGKRKSTTNPKRTKN